METASQVTHHITVAGILNDPNFQQARAWALFLEQNHPTEVKATTHQFFETQWEEFLSEIKATKTGKFHYHQGTFIAYVNEDEYLGDNEELSNWALLNYKYSDHSDEIVYKKKATQEFKTAINDAIGRSYCFMDIRIGEEIPQRILFELFTDIAPDSCENFRKLWGGTFTNQKGEKLTYKNTEFHRVVKGSFVQGGNLSKLGISSLAQSIFEGYFPDETFEINHTQVGLLGYCKKSGIKYSNECQFYVTTGYPLSFMDHKYVIFGRVIQGMRVFRKIEDLETLNQKPTCKVEIAECGEFDARR